MTTFSQIPGDLDIEIGTGDDLSMLCDFNISLTNYTFVAKVIKGDGVEVDMTIINTDLTNGKITLGLSDAQISTLGTENLWYLAWTITGTTRRVLAGDFLVRAYP